MWGHYHATDDAGSAGRICSTALHDRGCRKSIPIEGVSARLELSGAWRVQIEYMDTMRLYVVCASLDVERDT